MKIFSGVKPSGDLHIGNYLGAIRQFVELQNENKGVFCVVDLHAITSPQDPELLKTRTLNIAITYLAMGIDPDKSIVFIQSHVPAHAELGWILNTLTPVGELERMVQYKDAIAKGKPNFGGLLNYPTLMAADILLYGTEGVPVGEDQLQHIELARSVAERFNNKYGETFTVPKGIVLKDSARIMSLADPSRKMAKSDDDPDGSIQLIDPPEEIKRKIKKAVTDSGKEIAYSPSDKPAISNLMTIYSAFTGRPLDKIAGEFDGKSYVDFKEALAEIVAEGLKPFQEKYHEMQKEKGKVLDILRDGAKKASEIADKILNEAKGKMGIILPGK